MSVRTGLKALPNISEKKNGVIVLHITKRGRNKIGFNYFNVIKC